MDRNLEPWEYIVYVLVIACILLLFWRAPGVSIAFIFVVVIWLADVLVKYNFNFQNETAFADLSFASFAFLLGKAYELGVSGANQALFIQSTVFACVLLVAWYANIRFAKALQGLSRGDFSLTTAKRGPILGPILFAATSIALVVIPELFRS